MKPSRIAFAASMLACVLAAPTHAAVLQASASVSITNLTFTLVDLDLTDGIGPSFSFGDSDKWGSTGVIQLLDAQTSSTNRLGQGTGDFSGATSLSSDSTLLSDEQAAVSAHGGQALAQTTASSIAAQASTSLDTGVPQHDIKSAAEARLWTLGMNQTINLGAHTAVVVRGSYTVSASIQTGAAELDGAIARLSIDGLLGDQRIQISDAATARPGESLSATRTGSIDFMLTNTSNLGAVGGLAFDATSMAWVDSGVSPVPEADSAMLAMAGLGLLGGLAAIRRRQQAR